MNVLLIANSKDPFGRELKSELNKKKYNVSLLDFESLSLIDDLGNKDESYRLRLDKVRKIPKVRLLFRMFYIRKILNKNKYDIINIHFSRWYYLLIIPSFKNSKLVVTFYGSDFYRTSKITKLIQLPLYKKASAITFTNPLTLDSFKSFYKNFQSKSHVCRFGLGSLDFIDKNRSIAKKEIKEKIGFNGNKIIITCGYNSTREQQHEKIIRSICSLSSDTLKRVQFIFPMTYGDDLYRENIKKILYNTSLDYIILENYLLGDINSYIKLGSDIMINVLETDSFSGSMQEYLYADNLVITGKWLPYEVFDKEGIDYIKIDQVNNLAHILESAIDKNPAKGNRQIISKLSSWKSNINSWIKAYES